MRIRHRMWGKQKVGFFESYQNGGVHNRSIFSMSCHAQEVLVERSRNRIM